QYTGRRDQPADKQAEILASSGVSTESAAEMISDFNLGKAVNPELGYPVWHTSLSFNPDDVARLDSDKMRTIAEGYLQKMGLDNTQYVIVRHHDQPDNQHLHIIANRVGYDGKTIDDGRNFYRSKLALQELIAEHELTPIKGQRPELQHPERLRGTDLSRHEMLIIVNQAVAAETQRPHLLTALRAAGIGVEERFDKVGKATGISFEKDGYKFKGSELGRHLSSAGIDKQLASNEFKQQAASVVPAVKTDHTPLTVSAASSGATLVPSAKGEPVKEPEATVGQPAVGMGTSNSIPMVQSSAIAGGQGRTASRESTAEQVVVPTEQQEKESIADLEAQAKRAARREEMRRLLDLETEKMLAYHKVRPTTYVTEAKADPVSTKLSTEQNGSQPGKVQKSEENSTAEKPIDIVEAPAATSTQQSAPVPHVSEGTSDSGVSPEVTLPIIPRRAIAIQTEERILHPAVSAAVSKQSSTPIGEPTGAPSPIVGIAASLPIQEREAQPPVANVIPSPPTEAAVPTGVTSSSGELTHTSESVVSRSPLSPAVPGAVVPPVEPAAQPPQSPERTQKQLSLMSLAEKLISEVPDLPATALVIAPVVVTAPAVVTAPVVVIAPVVVTAPVVAEAVWQHGIIQMEANGKGTSEERLSAVRAALLAAGATVGEIVPPTVGRNGVPLLPYSFDPTTTSLGKVSQVLDDVQVAGKSKVQERPYPWRQPASVPGADNMKWLDREGQFNQAHVLIDDSAAGHARANAIADDLRRAGARVSEVKRDAQGLLTMQVGYHTHTLGIDVLNGVLDSANNSIGIKVQESQQNRDARYTGAVQVARQQKERSSAGMSYDD
ncbi:MAG: hypothetical protein EOO60_04175, partial [Hymenobacter sp.]